MLTPMHQVTLSRVKALSALCVRKHVSPLCQPVSPFKTLHALYISALCQRVTLFLKKVDNWSNILDWFSLMLKV